MPNFTSPLDPLGYALVDVLLGVPAVRSQLLHAAAQPVPPLQAVRATIDTGAALTFIDPTVRQALGLVPCGTVTASTPVHASGVSCYLYKVSLTLVHPTRMQHLYKFHPLITVAEMALIHLGSEVLLGCELLADYLFLYAGPTSQFILGY
jgi:hypothetical protein